MSDVPGCSVCLEEVWEGAKFTCGHAFCAECANGLFVALLSEDGEVETCKPGCRCQRPFCTTPRCPQCRVIVCATTVEWDFLHSVVLPQAATTGPAQDAQDGQLTTTPSPSNEIDDVVYLGMTTTADRLLGLDSLPTGSSSSTARARRKRASAASSSTRPRRATSTANRTGGASSRRHRRSTTRRGTDDGNSVTRNRRNRQLE